MSLLGLAAWLFAAGGILVIGYIIWLAQDRLKPVPQSPRPQPVLTIIVPVFDEAALIARKIANLRALTYPKLRAIVVDGGSTDGTVAQIPPELLLQTHLRDKTAQIAAALSGAGEWVLVTDCDAALPPDIVEQLMAAAGDDVGVVGARVLPTDAHALESLHWLLSDRLRELESRRGSAAIVTAPCYLARRALLADMPADALADDVHVACRAMLAGLRVVRANAEVRELRSPQSIGALIRHKYRKADAYLREIFRFLPHAPRMPEPQRTIFLWRAALLTVVPLLWTAATVVAATQLPPLLLVIVLVALTTPWGRVADRKSVV